MSGFEKKNIKRHRPPSPDVQVYSEKLRKNDSAVGCKNTNLQNVAQNADSQLSWSRDLSVNSSCVLPSSSKPKTPVPSTSDQSYCPLEHHKNIKVSDKNGERTIIANFTENTINDSSRFFETTDKANLISDHEMSYDSSQDKENVDIDDSSINDFTNNGSGLFETTDKGNLISEDEMSYDSSEDKENVDIGEMSYDSSEDKENVDIGEMPYDSSEDKENVDIGEMSYDSSEDKENVDIDDSSINDFTNNGSGLFETTDSAVFISDYEMSRDSFQDKESIDSDDASLTFVAENESQFLSNKYSKKLKMDDPTICCENRTTSKDPLIYDKDTDSLSPVPSTLDQSCLFKHYNNIKERETSEKTIVNFTENKTNDLREFTETTDKAILVSEDEMPGVCFQDKENVDSDGSSINDVARGESQFLQVDPALRQFDILDELEASDQEEGEVMDSNSAVSDPESDEEFPLDDFDKMLDERLPEKFKSVENKDFPVKLGQKIVLEEIGHGHFDLLPEGWMKIMHGSGMPVYLHKKSRVCTMGRPYYLGSGSSKSHNVPLSAIPCLHYKRASELEKKNGEETENKLKSQSHKSQSQIDLMSAEIETFEESKANQSLELSELHDYCQKVFKFKTLTLIPFKSWSERRKFVKMSKEFQKKQRLTLPGGTKLLKFPIKNLDGTVSKGEWIINPNGKSFVCILHEYLQDALKKHPKYEFKELENPATPYSATVFIEDLKYGFGVGTSRKHAKVEAAKAALEILIPGIKDKIGTDTQFGSKSVAAKKSYDNDVSIFDEIKVEDPRVAEFCAKTTEPPPFVILLTCLGRNSGGTPIEASYAMNKKSFKHDEFTMVVGNHKATVPCRNKREGKQRAAQAILKKLHPNIKYWGSLLRMYGNRSIKDIKEKKQEEQEITRLQSKASLTQPNFAILNKLKAELLKLKEKREAIQSKGKLNLPEDIVLPSLSSTDLNQVNLSSKE